jgi:hypothetical protein
MAKSKKSNGHGPVFNGNAEAGSSPEQNMHSRSQAASSKSPKITVKSKHKDSKKKSKIDPKGARESTIRIVCYSLLFAILAVAGSIVYLNGVSLHEDYFESRLTASKEEASVPPMPSNGSIKSDETFPSSVPFDDQKADSDVDASEIFATQSPDVVSSSVPFDDQKVISDVDAEQSPEVESEELIEDAAVLDESCQGTEDEIVAEVEPAAECEAEAVAEADSEEIVSEDSIDLNTNTKYQVPMPEETAETRIAKEEVKEHTIDITEPLGAEHLAALKMNAEADSSTEEVPVDEVPVDEVPVDVVDTDSACAADAIVPEPVVAETLTAEPFPAKPFPAEPVAEDLVQSVASDSKVEREPVVQEAGEAHQ